MGKKITLRAIDGNSAGYYLLMGVLGALIALGLGSAYYMEHQGHHVTGMTNQIVWGMPHVFAVFLIVAASGALNVASIASVFGKSLYKPLAPLSGLLAMSLLIGGLIVLVLDLGRPDRLIVAMTYYNFKSIFAWNIFLYNGFLLIVGVYLWMMLEKRFNKYSSSVGVVAFVWRLILTTGTGSIFGFLVSRQFYDAAIMAPLFILMSFAFGLAIFNIVLATAYTGTQRPLGGTLIERLRKLLGLFVLSVLFFVAIFHLTNLYATEHHSVEKFILNGDNVYTALFWLGYGLVGTVLPLALCYARGFARSLTALVSASVLVIAGGLSQMYVIIIGGQAFPLQLFPGKDVSSSFYDGVVNQYSPSLPEIALGVGGAALALAMVGFAVKALGFLPQSLADADVDTHHKPAPESEAAA
ncbi:MAG: polysulfide reductase NrfD [Gammaproteobacteria bacterium]|nr:polysulfide reductase NrfD [Gammaproteobacteria bacterium]MDH5801795.1 polysulfide reductase NrfD [Gammaproteobacteria bacterium]